MKIIFTADPHIDAPARLSTVLPNGINSKLHDRLTTLGKVIAYAQQEKATHLFILGDIFEPLGGKIDKLVALFTIKLMRIAMDVCPVYVVSGNHDYYKGHWVSEILPCNVITKPTDMQIEDWSIGMIPWTRSQKVFRESYEELKNTRMLLMHQWTTRFPFHDDYGELIDSKLFEGRELVLSGHYHNAGKVGNVTYVGSPIQLSFGEVGQKKGIMVFDGINVKFKRFTGQPEYRVVEIHNKEDLDKFIQDYETMHTYEVKIMSPDVPYTKDLNKYNIKVERFIRKPQTWEEEEPIASFTPKEAIKSRIKESKLDIDKKAWEKLAMEIYNEVIK